MGNRPTWLASLTIAIFKLTLFLWRVHTGHAHTIPTRTSSEGVLCERNYYNCQQLDCNKRNQKHEHCKWNYPEHCCGWTRRAFTADCLHEYHGCMCRLILSAESQKGAIVYKGNGVLIPFWFSTNDLLYDMDACVGPLLILSAESQ